MLEFMCLEFMGLEFMCLEFRSLEFMGLEFRNPEFRSPEFIRLKVGRLPVCRSAGQRAENDTLDDARGSHPGGTHQEFPCHLLKLDQEFMCLEFMCLASPVYVSRVSVKKSLRLLAIWTGSGVSVSCDERSPNLCGASLRTFVEQQCQVVPPLKRLVLWVGI